MEACKEYNDLSLQSKGEIYALITKMKGKSNIADVIIEKSDLSKYDFKVTVMKYNSSKGWATIGYIKRHRDTFKLSYRPILSDGEKSDAGKTKGYLG